MSKYPYARSALQNEGGMQLDLHVQSVQNYNVLFLFILKYAVLYSLATHISAIK